MKKIFTLIALAMVSVMGAKAQDITDNYNRIHAGFSTFCFEKQDNLMGFNAGYTYGINITGENMPMFVEVGGEYNFVTLTKDNVETTFHAVQVPVNVTYKFGNEDFNVAPFLGESFRVGTSFKDGGVDVYESEALDYSRFCAYFNAGVNFNIMHFTIGYRFMMSNGSMQPKVTIGNITKGNKADYNNLFYVAYCF